MTRRERARLIRSLTLPMALLVVGAVLFAGAQDLARVDGFRLYGLVQALGEIVGMIGLVWLVAVVIRALTSNPRRS